MDTIVSCSGSEAEVNVYLIVGTFALFAATIGNTLYNIAIM